MIRRGDGQYLSIVERLLMCATVPQPLALQRTVTAHEGASSPTPRCSERVCLLVLSFQAFTPQWIHQLKLRDVCVRM